MTPAIYTIAKNEAYNVEGFMSAAEGCDVYVLDTGSTDNTVQLFKEHGANVAQKTIEPWRFDTARNEALALVPDNVDVCVSLDMDERISTGWQRKLKSEWAGNIGNYRYIDEWSDEDCTIPSIQSSRTRLHSRKGYEWHRLVHEVIRPLPDVTEVWCDTSILVKHYQKGGLRDYTSAVKKLLKEDPNDVNGWLQLAVEYQRKEKYSEAVDAFRQYIKRTEEDESEAVRFSRAHAWLNISQCLYELNKKDAVIRALLSAVAAEPKCREAWTHLAHVVMQLDNPQLAYGAAVTAYNITQPPNNSAIETICWGELPKQIADHAFGTIMKTGEK
jgi:glycosyltransferase involved in cell wall biosynthesis